VNKQTTAKITATGALLTSCANTAYGNNDGGSSPEISGSSLADQVEQTLDGRAGQNLTCEDVEKVKQGAISDCTSGSLLYRVTFEDDQGHYRVERG